MRTSEGLEDEQDEDHLAEDVLKQAAPRLIAPLEEVQHRIPTRQQFSSWIIYSMLLQ